MRIKTVFLLFALFLTTSSALAQEKDPIILNDSKYKKDRVIIQNNLNIQQVNNQSDNQKYTMVNQIGHENIVMVNLINQNSHQAEYNQYGNQNSIDVLSKSKQTNQIVSQMGDQNNYTNFNYNYFEAQNINVHQNGNRQNIEVFGENSISKDMIIKMEGADKSLIIRNYN